MAGSSKAKLREIDMSNSDQHTQKERTYYALAFKEMTAFWMRK